MKHHNYIWTGVIACGLFATWQPSPAHCQEKKQPAKKAAADDTPAKEKAPKEKPDSDEKPAAGEKAAAKAYAEKLAAWKDVIKALRDIKLKFAVAEKEQAAELQKQWDDTIAQGQALLPEVR